MTGPHPVVATALDLRWQDVPARVRRRTARCLLDTLACAVAGAATTAGQVTHRWAAASAPGRHVVVGRSTSSSATGAVAANAFAANALDLDDGYRPLKGHPGAVVVPAALAAAEATGATGADLLAAVLVGYEVALRAGTLLRAEYAAYHGTGAWAPVGAAAAVARLRGLDAATTATALAVAEFHAPITPVMRTVDHPAMLKDGAGWGALAGYAAVDLAVAGVTAPPTLFEHRAAEAADLPAIGRVHLVEDVYVKLAATCRWAQPAVAAVRDAVVALRGRAGGIDAAGVASVRIGTFAAATHLARPEPVTTEEAQFSIPWAVACALLDGRVGPEQVAATRLGDEATRELAARVRIEVDPALDAAFPRRALAWAEVTATDGRRATSRACPAPGEAGDGTPDAVVEAKAASLVTGALGDGAGQVLLAAVRALPTAHDVADLVAAVRAPAP